MRSTTGLFLRSCIVFFTSAMIASAYGASSVPSYTATDLGPENESPSYLGITLSSTGANGTLTTSNGTVYAFPRTDNLVANPQSLLNMFPSFTNAPRDYYGYSYFDSSNVFLNKAGVFAATDLIGIDGHSADSWSTIYTATRQAAGAFGPLTALTSTPNNVTSGGQVAWVIDLNNTGKILGIDTGVPNGTRNLYSSDGRDVFLYDLNSGVRTEVASLLPNGWYFPIPIAIDDQGRILVAAESYPSSNSVDLFLLTPAGLSSSPIPAPEPTTFVTLAVGGIGLAIRRRWKS